MAGIALLLVCHEDVPRYVLVRPQPGPGTDLAEPLRVGTARFVYSTAGSPDAKRQPRTWSSTAVRHIFWAAAVALALAGAACSGVTSSDDAGPPPLSGDTITTASGLRYI